MDLVFTGVIFRRLTGANGGNGERWGNGRWPLCFLSLALLNEGFQLFERAAPGLDRRRSEASAWQADAAP